MSDDRSIIVECARRRVASLLEAFCTDPRSRNGGGIVNAATGYADSRGSIWGAQDLFAAYLYPDFPEHHLNPDLLRRLRMHLDFMRRRQRDDGTISLGANHGGGNEVGFTLPAVCETYRRVERGDAPGREEILAVFKDYILRGADAVRRLFPYTSNHRWAACAGPLAVVNSLFPDDSNGRVIEEYLSDGVDMDVDGLYYEERSPNYNMVANWGLLLLSDHWGRRELLELMARNLRFSLCMRQPCGEAETLFSHRQDRGGAGAAWGDYYLFKRMAVETGDGQFAQAADELLAGAGKKGPGSAFIPLIYMFDDERLARERVPRQPLPDRFEIRFRDTPIWRWRRGAVAATVVADEGGHWFDITQGTWGGSVRSDAVVSYHVEDAIVDAIKIRWGSGTGGFRPETIEYPAPGRLKLWYQDPGWDHVAHYRPRAKWGPRRIETNQCATMELDVDDDGGIGVIVNIGGWTDMMVNVQFLLRENGRLTGPDGKVTALQPGGRTFTACAGAYELAGPAGGRLRICGLPESEARCGIGDSRTITGLAETRCHRLIVCCFTPVRLSFRLEPAR